MSILVVDTETTGFPPSCRMVQIAWRLYTKDGVFLNNECYIIKPDRYVIPEQCVKIHGISTEFAEKNGIDINTVLTYLEDIIYKGAVEKVVAHNMKFDDAVIKSEISRSGNLELFNKWTNLNKECTMLMDAPKGQKWLKLALLYEKCFGVPPNVKLHQADADAQVCADIYFHLLNNRAIS